MTTEAKSTKRLSSGYFRSKPAGVDRDAGIIRGVSVVRAGEAKGHGVHLDKEFVADVVRLGNAASQGIKSRFGHPNMCNEALGTYVGRFKDFRLAEGGAKALADLYLSDAADYGPKGNLGSYLMELAEKEADMFGTSIVFRMGREYRKRKDGSKVYKVGYREYQDESGESVDPETLSEELFVEISDLHACDAVDEPAANEGLFDTNSYRQGQLAADATEWLDLHPQFLKLAANHPEVVDDFLSRYRARRAEQNPEEDNAQMSNESAAPAEPEVELHAEQPAEPEVTPTSEPALSEEPKTRVDELARAVKDFGAEAATEAFGNGGGYNDALRAAYDAQKVSIEALNAKISDLETQLAASKGKRTATPSNPIDLGEGEAKPKRGLIRIAGRN